LKFSDVKVSLPNLSEREEMKFDYEIEGLSTKYHPMQVLRKQISSDGLLKSSELKYLIHNTQVRMAGYVITRQKPATAKGFAFLTLEDENGMINVVVKPGIYNKYRQVFRLEPIIVVEGVIQKREENLNIIADVLIPLRKESERQNTMYTDSLSSANRA
jgi:error-prone DNA polymerase